VVNIDIILLAARESYNFEVFHREQ